MNIFPTTPPAQSGVSASDATSGTASPADASSGDVTSFQAALAAAATNQSAPAWWQPTLPDTPTRQELLDYIVGQSVMQFIRNPPKIDLK